MYATDARAAELRVLPLPDHTAATRTWTLAGRGNEVISLSWVPDGRRLSYIAGSQNGAGIAGDPYTEYREVDPTTGRPTASAVQIPEAGCLGLAGSLHPTPSGVFVGVCSHVYWIADGTLSILPDNLEDAALRG